MDKQYYLDYYMAERNHWFFRARNTIIMEHISEITKDRRDLKILNIGVATGHTSELLQKFGTVMSIEYDNECYHFTKSKLPNLELINGSIIELPFDENSYDLVCAFDVIEHIEDDNLGVEEMQRVCKKDGFVVLTVPAFMSLWSHHDKINHHFRRYKKSEIKNLIKKHGEIQYLSYFNFFLFPFVFLFRKANNLLGFSKNNKLNNAKVGSDLDYFKKEGFISKLLYNILRAEKSLIRKRIALPFGVSLLATWKK